MRPNIHTFLFSPPEGILPLTSRRVHLRRLYDVLHLSIQRGDLHRARRAWAILARCKEMDWRASWTLAVGLLDHSGHMTESNQTKIDYLRTMMLHSENVRTRSQRPPCSAYRSAMVEGTSPFRTRPLVYLGQKT